MVCFFPRVFFLGPRRALARPARGPPTGLGARLGQLEASSWVGPVSASSRHRWAGPTVPARGLELGWACPASSWAGHSSSRHLGWTPVSVEAGHSSASSWGGRSSRPARGTASASSRHRLAGSASSWAGPRFELNRCALELNRHLVHRANFSRVRWGSSWAHMGGRQVQLGGAGATRLEAVPRAGSTRVGWARQLEGGGPRARGLRSLVEEVQKLHPISFKPRWRASNVEPSTISPPSIFSYCTLTLY
ncbi:UNVERIFIED_CONTAM: hypothetical protein Sradi_0202600 [Sesamum radiatum]|uniref:Uncharacterized protein n=1 Tax=Sesamum radiatum TaxID=300843 RepID=A0AAW2W023_SESRA